MMNVNRTCRQHSLAHGPVAQVHGCEDCGCISIHMGPTTLRLDADALRSLWITLGDAVEHLDRQRGPLDIKSLAGVTRGDA